MNLQTRKWLALLLASPILVGGFLIRYVYACQDTLWLDELHTNWVINGSFADVATRAADGNQNPLFFWLSWLASIAVQPSEFQVRCFSFLVGIGTLGLSTVFAWKWTKSVCATILVAISVSLGETFVYYGSEARPYSCLHFLSLLQVALFFRMLFKKQQIERARSQLFGWTLLLAILTAGLVYVHITAVSLAFAEAIFLLVWQLKERKTGPALQCGMSLVLAAIICLPLVSQNFVVFERRGNWQAVTSLVDLGTDFLRVSVIFGVIPLLGFLVMRLLTRDASLKPLTTVADEDLDRNTMNWRILFCCLWGCCPFAVVALAEYLSVPMALTRYTQVGAVAWTLLLALLAAKVPSFPPRIIVTAAVLVCFVFFDPLVRQQIRSGESGIHLPTLRVEDWKGVVSEVDQNPAKSNQTIYMFSNLIEDVDAIRHPDEAFQEYLTFPLRGLYQSSLNQSLVARPTMGKVHFTDNDIERIHQDKGCWLVVRGNDHLVFEIANELRGKFQLQFGFEPVVMVFRTEESPFNPVILLNVDCGNSGR